MKSPLIDLWSLRATFPLQFARATASPELSPSRSHVLPRPEYFCFIGDVFSDGSNDGILFLCFRLQPCFCRAATNCSPQAFGAWCFAMTPARHGWLERAALPPPKVARVARQAPIGIGDNKKTLIPSGSKGRPNPRHPRLIFNGIRVGLNCIETDNNRIHFLASFCKHKKNALFPYYLFSNIDMQSQPQHARPGPGYLLGGYSPTRQTSQVTPRFHPMRRRRPGEGSVSTSSGCTPGCRTSPASQCGRGTCGSSS